MATGSGAVVVGGGGGSGVVGGAVVGGCVVAGAEVVDVVVAVATAGSARSCVVWPSITNSDASEAANVAHATKPIAVVARHFGSCLRGTPGDIGIGVQQAEGA